MPYPYVVFATAAHRASAQAHASAPMNTCRGVVCVSADRNVYVTPLIVIVSPSCGTPVKRTLHVRVNRIVKRDGYQFRWRQRERKLCRSAISENTAERSAKAAQFTRRCCVFR